MSHHMFFNDVDCFWPRRMQLHGWYWKPWPSCTLATWTCCIFFHPSNSLCFSHMKCWSPATNIFLNIYKSRLQKICITWLLWLKNHFLFLQLPSLNVFSLPETSIFAAKTWNIWNTFSFPFGFRPIFRCELAVSFRGCFSIFFPTQSCHSNGTDYHQGPTPHTSQVGKGILPCVADHLEFLDVSWHDVRCLYIPWILVHLVPLKQPMF